MDFWIRMVFKDSFDVVISVNCENADGVTEVVCINPQDFLGE